MARRAADLTGLRPDRVCLVKPSSLGDVVHALPVLTALRDLWPNAHIAWVVNQGLRGLLDGHPHLDEVIPFDRGQITLGPRGVRRALQFAQTLARRQFDLAVDLQGLTRSALMTFATRAPVRVGFADPREPVALGFYTHTVQPPEAVRHAVERLLAVASALGADVRSPRFIAAIDEQDRAWARDALESVPQPRLALNLGARWLTKRWPPQHFASVARRAHELIGAGLVLVGAPEDRPLADAFTHDLGGPPVLDLCGRTSLPQLAALSAEVDLFLSNDTGPLHLAAASGARVLGVYTCTQPAKTGPYGPNASAVATRIWCAGRCVKQCDRLDCMTELTPERVWHAVLNRLQPSGRLAV